jgi:hypothetical protein
MKPLSECPAHSASPEKGSQRLAAQSKENMDTVARCGTMLTQAFQDTSRGWLELAQKQWQRNLEGMPRLAGAKSVQEFSDNAERTAPRRTGAHGPGRPGHSGNVAQGDREGARYVSDDAALI